jgi:acyl carrier protein phosphodiesterase
VPGWILQKGGMMNWLAHIYFSEPDTEYQLGNLLTDILRPKDRGGFGPMFNLGIECHFLIDRFTDSHEAVKRSRMLLYPKYRHFSRVIVDIYYDHFLALNWACYCDCPYHIYIDQFHEAVKNTALVFPPYARERLNQIIAENWLGTYDQINDVARAFARLALRTRKPGGDDIAQAANELQLHHEAFHMDFEEFFKDLNRVIHDWRIDTSSSE